MQSIVFAEHHLNEFQRVFVPEYHIVAAFAFKVNMRDFNGREIAVELPVLLEQEILRAAGHEYLRDTRPGVLQAFYQHLRVAVAFKNCVEVAEALAIVVVVCDAVVLAGLHSGDLMNDQSRGHRRGLSEVLRVSQRGVERSEASHRQTKQECVLSRMCQTESPPDIIHKLIADECAVLMRGGKPVQPEAVLAARCDYREAVLLREPFRDPVSGVPGVAVQQK